MAYDLTRGTFVPSSAIRSVKSIVLQAQERQLCASFGPLRGGNQPLFPWTNMSFALGKQRFVCFWHLDGFFGHIRPPTWIDFRACWTHHERNRRQVQATWPHLCNSAREMGGKCIARNGHKVDEVMARAAHGAKFAQVKSLKM